MKPITKTGNHLSRIQNIKTKESEAGEWEIREIHERAQAKVIAMLSEVSAVVVVVCVDRKLKRTWA